MWKQSTGYSDCKFMVNGNTPDYLTVQLNTSNLRSKE